MSSSSRRPPRSSPPSAAGTAARDVPRRELTRREEWIALVVGVLGVCAFLYVMPQLSQLANTRGYVAVPATLEGVQRQISPAIFSRKEKKLRLWTEKRESILYRYSAAGQSYVGTDTVSAVPRGPFTVYYDPAEPGRSVFKRPALLPAVAEFLGTVALLGYALRGLRRRARQRRGRL
jgi:hypothetical protein